MKLRPYQERVIDELRGGFLAGHIRQILALATGSGKTVVAAHIIKSAVGRGHRCLFIVDRIILINQSVSTFQKMGLQVGVMQGENTLYTPDDDVIVCSIQTLGRRQLPDRIGVIIIDEAHVLHAHHKRLMEKWDLVPVIGLSATPLTKGLAEYFTNLVRGPSVKELTDEGALVSVRAYCPSEEALEKAIESVSTQAGDFKSNELSQAINSKVIVGDIVSTYQAKGEQRQALCFAIDIQHSQAIVEEFLLNGISAAHIDGYMDQDERDHLMEAFRDGKYRILSSVYVLGVGFDYPAVSCAILARPTLSEMLDMQQKGRVLRPADGKEDSILLDHAGNCVRFGLPIHFEVPDLSDEKKSNSRSKRKQKKQVTCIECGYVMEPGQQTCASCGIDRPRAPSEVVTTDGVLVEFGSSESGTRSYTEADKKRWAAGLKWIGLHRRKAPGWPFANYMDRFGSKPRFLFWRITPREPDKEIINWVRHKAILWAKRKNKDGRWQSNINQTKGTTA